MNGSQTLDLVVVVPGADEREGLTVLLSSRCDSIGIRKVQYQILKHVRRDPGCFHEAPGLLQPFQAIAARALVLLDHEGSGQENRSPEDLAQDLSGRLAASGWGERAGVVVLTPEFEVWVWSDSPHVEQVLGWVDRPMSLRDWLESQGLWPAQAIKPPDPKEALTRVLRETTLRRSAAIYGELARRVSLERCEDPSFHALGDLLRGWFPSERAV